jgi:NADH-quinone oxidoreductase subunit G
MSTDIVKTIKITVDGHQIDVPENALLLEALKLQGLDIPNFCYYWNLPAQASCRMCLVRIEKVPRLQPSCTTVVRDGMVVETNTPELVDMRRGMLEFMLANHPLDCPVCDRGGECELQDMTFKFGNVDARFTEEKHAQPEVDVSPFIYNDAQRCVFCYRCTRVCDLWMDVGALAKLNRGHHETIGTFDGWLDCEHCGNCVDVCPTGTLMHTSYKYGPRPWNLDETETTCNYCADGCRVRLGSRNNVVHRSVARQGTGINEEYLCVKGRYGMDFVNSTDRVLSPLVRRDGMLVPVSWDEALETAAKRLGEVAASKGADAVAVLGSRRITNEGNFAVADVARAIGTKNLSWKPDFDLGRFFAAVGGRLATKQDILDADRILVVGGDPKEYQPLTAYFILQAVTRFNAQLYVAGSRLSRIRKRAAQFVHTRPGGEVALLQGLADAGAAANAAGAAGVEAAEIDSLREALASGSRVVVMVGDELGAEALEAAAGLGALLAAGDRQVTYRPLVYYNNSIGAHDVLGGAAADYDAVMGAAGDSISALYAVGTDMFDEQGGGEELRERLGRLDCLVVQDVFLTDLARMADVVLPACTFAEQDGTFTNIGGEVQRVHKAVEPSGTSRPDWMIAAGLARQLGADPGYRGSVAAVYKRLAEANEAYAPVTYQRLAREGTVQTERAAAEVSRDAVVARLAEAAGRVDRSAAKDERPIEMGEGLFYIGAVASRSKLLTEAFVDGRAKGRPADEEAALIQRKTV